MKQKNILLQNFAFNQKIDLSFLLKYIKINNIL